MKKKSHIHKGWIKHTLISALLTMFLVVVINYINDPLWVYSHNNFTNKEQVGFNERQQKTNLLYFGNKDYDSILLGNSKVTYINQNKFRSGKLFNYSASAMRPEEYHDYIEFSKKTLRKDLNYIIIGLDFSSCTQQNGSIESSKPYFTNTTSKAYRYKQLLSYDTLLYSLRNFMSYFSKKKAAYDRNNIKVKIGYDQTDGEFKLDLDQLKKDSKELYKNLSYNKNLPQIWNKLKTNNPNSKFIFLLLPDMSPGFLLNQDSKKIYDSCFDDATHEFGIVYNFMYFNDITTNPKHYYDMAHFRPYVGNMILENINLYNPVDLK